MFRKVKIIYQKKLAYYFSQVCAITIIEENGTSVEHFTLIRHAWVSTLALHSVISVLICFFRPVPVQQPNGMVNISVVLPAQKDFIDVYQKHKFCFNLIVSIVIIETH